MSILTYIKWAALVGAGWWLFHAGEDHANVAAEAAKAAQLAQVGQALVQQSQDRIAAENQLQAVEDAYDQVKDLPPVHAGLATRVLIAAGSCRDPVPQAPAVAAGAHPSAPVPASDPRLAELLQRVIDTCTADSEQLSAVIQLAPQ